MTAGATGPPGLTVAPVTPELWPRLESFFGPRGAYSHCWCTWWRQRSTEFDAGSRQGGAGNRELLHRITAEGRVPGLLAFEGDEPVGWVSIAPREEFGRVYRSRNLRPDPPDQGDPAGQADAGPAGGVWALVCFWMPPVHRRRGIGTALLDAAVAHAAERGAAVVEAYPVDTHGERVPSAEIFTGTLEMFLRAGFTEVRRRTDRRPVVQRTL
jgi:GNAT superfamily N-acetyltransferase